MAFDNAHYMLAQALRKAPEQAHPKAPYHWGGPQPKVDAHGYVQAALWLAAKARPLAAEKDLPEFDRWVELAAQQLKAGREDTTRRGELFRADASKTSKIPLKCAHWAAHEAANWAWRAIYSGGAARPSAGNFAKHLAKVRPDEVPAFLRELEGYCVQLEALNQIRDRKLELTSDPVKALWRGNDGKSATHWLLRLKKAGRYALVCKLAKTGKQWTVVEGSRDDVLATVSEDRFEQAVAATLASDR